MYERTYKVRIHDSNRIIFIKNKEVRTPTEAIVTESELKVIKISLASSGCKNYKVEEINKLLVSDFQEVYNKEVITPLEKKVVPTYEQIKAKLSSRIKVQPKISRGRQKGPIAPIAEYKFKNEAIKTSFYIPLELQVNREFLLSQIPVKKEDFEIKIEDLKIESDSVLKKFLRV